MTEATKIGENGLQMFKVPLNFVVPAHHAWPELSDGTFLTMTDAERAHRAILGFDSWVMYPYQYFKRHGLNVGHAPVPVPGKINVLGGRALILKDCRPSTFLVVCRADSHYPVIADYVIELNGVNVGRPGTSFLPHPPLPGLIPRDRSRSGLKTLGYKGLLANLDSRFRDEAFQARLAELGITLRLDSFNLKDGTLKDDVQDFREVDAILAVRNLTVLDAASKPANKLVNAWRAGIPAILSPEPAYQELRRSELDYFEVRTPDEVIACLERLVNEPGLYARMAENGLARGADFAEERIYGLWPDLFNGPIHEEYQRWLRRPWPVRALRFARGVIGEKRMRRDAKRHRTEGRRILDG
jgi:hypothetical protein